MGFFFLYQSITDYCLVFQRETKVNDKQINKLENLVSEYRQIRQGQVELEKRIFITGINQLKEHKKPKKGRVQHQMNYIYENRSLIFNYKMAVKNKLIKGYFENYLNGLNEFQKYNFALEFNHYYFGYKFKDDYGYLYNNELDERVYINIIPDFNLKDIINVSSRTISRWIKRDIEQKQGHFQPV